MPTDNKARPRPAHLSAAVEIRGTPVERIAYRGNRVVTFAQIDQVHLRPEGTAGRTFRENRNRFTEGTDFIQLDQPDEIRRLGFSRPQGGIPASLTLVTERGYRRLCKSLNDDLAWDVFDEMLDSYFGDDRPAPLPDFSNPADAARAWAEQYEARILAERTKAEIGSRREATAMSTASIAVRRADKLEAELDRSLAYATVKRMQLIYHGQKFDWRKLKAASVEMGIPSRAVYDQNYGTVNAYHASAWREAYALEIPAPIDENQRKSASREVG